MSRSFEPWYREEHPRVLATMAVTARDLEAARDVTAEAFARALERWDRVGAMASPGGWTCRVALNLLRRRLRRSALEQQLLRRVPRREPPPLSDAAVGVWAAVATLPPGPGPPSPCGTWAG